MFVLFFLKKKITFTENDDSQKKNSLCFPQKSYFHEDVEI